MVILETNDDTRVIIYLINPKRECHLYFKERSNAIKMISSIEYRTANDMILLNDDYGLTIYIPYSNIGLIEVI